MLSFCCACCCDFMAASIQPCLRWMCLSPSHSMRRQLITSFGLITFMTVFGCVLLTVLSALQGGMVIQENAREMMWQQVSVATRLNSRYQANVISERLGSLRSNVALLNEIVRDIVVGYPDQDFEHDIHVPFQNISYKYYGNDGDNNGMNSSSSKSYAGTYPFRAPQDVIDYDWRVQDNFDPDNCIDHVHEERSENKYYVYFDVSTAHASITFPGNCDPEAVPGGWGYLENCTDLNNDFNQGGVLHYGNPDVISSTKSLAIKSRQIATYLKPIWEAEASANKIYVVLKNRGAGLYVSFPSFDYGGPSSYTSIGCDWMREINPYTNRPLGTEEEIERCAPDGTEVDTRFYNGLERAFCRDQALNPGVTRLFGPYKSIGGTTLWITAGQAIFDRRTGEFIGCTAMDIQTRSLQQLLDASLIADYSQVTLIQPNGFIVGGPNQSKFLWETNQTSKEAFQELISVIDWNDAWDPQSVQDQLLAHYVNYNESALSAFPIPTPPIDQYDPDYRPEFYIVFSTGGQVFDVIDQIDDTIDSNISELIMTTVMIGCAGFLLVLLVIWSVSRTLTLPLVWMEKISSHIVNNDKDDKGKKSINDKNPPLNQSSTSHLTAATGAVDPRKLFWCTNIAPFTEINYLVKEFEKMIQGFSGNGPSIAAPCTSIQEIPNKLKWQNLPFGHLYQPQEYNDQQESGNSMYTPVSLSSLPSLMVAPYGPATVMTATVSSRSIDTNKNHGNSNDSSSISSSTSDKHQDLLAHISKQEQTARNPNKATPKTDQELSIKQLGAVIPVKQNFGPNLQPNINEGQWIDSESTILRKSQPTTSKLFWWIVTYIMLPLLLTNTLMCTIVSVDLLTTLPRLVKIAESLSFQLELDTLRAAAILRASFAERFLGGLMRDSYVITRTAQYVVFDVVSRQDSLVIDTNIQYPQQCKTYSKQDRSCPFFQNEMNTLCDCEWEDDIRGQSSCRDYTFDTRYIQKAFYGGQKTDIDPVTGNRYGISTYPDHSTSAETTQWYSDITEMPGFDSAISSSQGYGTTYDRFRAQMAMSAVVFPLYNYQTVASNALSRTNLGVYFSFDADGSLWGYDGCGDFYADLPYFQSNDENRAHIVAPELCPKGKFGYDARCRDWYHYGKVNWIENKETSSITSHYSYSSSGLFAMSASSVVTHPVTGEVIGQTLIDFTPTRIINALLKETKSKFAILITPREQAGGDTVVGPDYEAGSKPALVGDVVLPHDQEGSTNRVEFDEIVQQMKAGGSGLGEFIRMTRNDKEENIRIAYAPVYARTLRPIEPDRYSSGSRASRTLMFSVGVAETTKTLQEPFTEIEHVIHQSLKRLTIIYALLVILLTLISIVLASQVSISLTKPIIVLLRIVQNVNTGKIDEDVPDFKAGSVEANQVYNSFAKLYKIVRVANRAFFEGDLMAALSAIHDALRLYRKVNDHKAVGIACNNLGCILFALSQELKVGSECQFANGSCCVKNGLKYLDESVTIATVRYQHYNTVDSKARYGFQLADRYFNRAMFLMHSSSDKCCPKNARRTAHSDVKKAHELDESCTATWRDDNLLLKYSDMYFERLIRRLHGLAMMSRADPSILEAYDPRDILSEANGFLSSTWSHVTLPVYNDMSRIGRLQQLEGAVMNLQLSSGKYLSASQIGMRMIGQDEYLIDSSYAAAAQGLLCYSAIKDKDCPWSREQSLKVQQQIAKQLRSCKGMPKSNTKRSVVFALEISDKLQYVGFLKDLNKGCLSLFDVSCKMGDTVAVVCYGDHLSSLQTNKIEVMTEQLSEGRKHLDIASKGTSGMNGSPALPLGIELILDSMTNATCKSRTNNNDDDGDVVEEGFVVFITDGTMWDEQALELILSEIQEQQQQEWTNPNFLLHIITIGIEVNDERIVNVIKDKLSNRSFQSRYIGTSRHEIDQVLKKVGESLISTKDFFFVNSVQYGLTIEKF